MEWRDENGNLCIGIRPEAIKPASEPESKETEPVEKPKTQAPAKQGRPSTAAKKKE